MKTMPKARKAGLNAVIAGFAMAVLPLAAFAIGGNNIPEPDTILLIGLGVVAVWVARRIKK
ncbi:MAG: PEP-CTERM sorting domain-containing protein [Burkholderiales bacterium]|nr:PEP-CTERM sorting domain-containing protein [Burkholderiales bacterium]